MLTLYLNTLIHPFQYTTERQPKVDDYSILFVQAVVCNFLTLISICCLIVPQLVLDDLILRNCGADANIIVTQPRRISAIGVSERIAAERGEVIGETAGYSIRLESKKSSKTRLLLCTTGT